ncbi:MAG: hypothetical protein JXB05_10010 [Myxococcaceae bacterium]|nr:hypothetical protein [Myxococcaceae bacterium]
MRSLLIALTFTASTALAQTTGTIVLLTPNNETSLRVGKKCDLARTVNWTYNGSTVTCSDLRIWLASGTSCAEEPPADSKELDRVTQAELAAQRTGQVTFEVQDLPGFTDEAPCPVADREDDYRLCASIKLSGAVDCGSGTFQKDDIEIVYDTKPPAVPTIESVAALDSALSIRVNPPDDASKVHLSIERADGTGSAWEMNQSVDQTLFRVENLENGVTYRVTAQSEDSAENRSAASAPQEGTPIPTRGFFDRYVEAQGAETGGCGAAAGGLAGGWVLAVLGFWLSSRRNRS